MPNFSNRFFGSPKISAYSGWLSALAGGFLLGVGVIIFLITPMITDTILRLNPNIIIDYEADSNLRLIGAVCLFMGLVFTVLGLFEIHHSLKQSEREHILLILRNKDQK